MNNRGAYIVMKEKWDNLFKNKKTENLIFFLVVLIVTLIIINQILNEDTDKNYNENTQNTAVLASSIDSTSINSSSSLSKNLEEILTKIEGVGDVSVLITYSEAEVTKVPMYNENNTVNESEETASGGSVKKTTSTTSNKEVIMGADDNPVIQTIETPKIEGAIITAQGASNITVKSNIISAVEAATGLATHKIQVFEMKSN
jgi:stage III sporulation protein AG